MHNTKYEQEAEDFFTSTINDILNHEEIEDEEQSLSQNLFRLGVTKRITYTITLASAGPAGVLNLTFAKPGTETILTAEIAYTDWFQSPITKRLDDKTIEVLESKFGFLNVN